MFKIKLVIKQKENEKKMCKQNEKKYLSKLFKTDKTDWRFGLGYLHHSNGHTNLPNQGLNSLAASISAKIDSKNKPEALSKPHHYKSKSQTYLTTRFGIGQNVLSKKFD